MNFVTVSISDLRFQIEELDLAQIEISYGRKQHDYLLVRSHDLFKLVETMASEVCELKNPLLPELTLFERMSLYHPSNGLIAKGEETFDAIFEHEELKWLFNEVTERVSEVIPDDTYNLYKVEVMHNRRIVIENLGDKRIHEFYRLEAEGSTIQSVIDVKNIFNQIKTDIEAYTCNEVTIRVNEARIIFEAVCNLCHSRLLFANGSYEEHHNYFMATFDESIDIVIHEALQETIDKLACYFPILKGKHNRYLILCWDSPTAVKTHVVEGTKGFKDMFDVRDYIYRDDYISEQTRSAYEQQIKLFIE